MKEITAHKVQGVEKELTVRTADFPGPGGAHHIYECRYDAPSNVSIQRIRFQKGPVPKVGINGVTNEILLAIVMDRLEDFQKGDFACPENEEALKHVALALHALKKRTQDRLARGVEGKMEK